MSAESPYMARKACDACPFRSDRPFYLDPERAREFASMVEIGTFDCHKTIEFGDEGEQVKQPNTQACVGGRYMLAPGKSRLEWLAERMGLLIHDVHPDQPVFDSIEEWLDAVDNMDSPRSRKL